jgi:hypothetical protein
MDTHAFEKTLVPTCVLTEEEEVAAATPYVDYEMVWNQFGLGVAVCPRREYGVDIWIGPLCVTVRWRHGWIQRKF